MPGEKSWKYYRHAKMPLGTLKTTINPQIKNESDSPEFKAAVSLSRKWNAREAGREVAIDVLTKIGKNTKIKFILLFSSIHYKDYGGFKELLKGVWDIIPKSTKLIGGTVAGFTIPDGCFLRGVTALAVSYPNMEVEVVVGKNTKRSPTLAVKHCTKELKKKFEDSKFDNGFIIDIPSGTKTPQMPGIGRKRVINSKSFAYLLKLGLDFSLENLQFGVGREEEMFDYLMDEMRDFSIIGGSSMDDNKGEENFQFINEDVVTNSIVILAGKTDLRIKLNGTYGMEESGITFKTTKLTSRNRIISEINGKPAKTEIKRLLNWSDSFFDERIYRRSWYYPIGFYTPNNGLAINNMLFFMGENIMVTRRFESEEVKVLRTSGRKLIDSVDENLEKFSDKNNKFAFIVSCCTRLELLGDKVQVIREKLNSVFNDTPYIQIYAGGENIYSEERKNQGGYVCHTSDSFNVLSLYES